MKTIKAFGFPLTDETKVEIPEDAAIIWARIADNNSAVLLYILHDVEAPLVAITFYTIKTGDEFPDTFPGRFIRTLLHKDGSEYHLFIKPIPAPQRGEPIVVNPNDPGAPTGERGGE